MRRLSLSALIVIALAGCERGPSTSAQLPSSSSATVNGAASPVSVGTAAMQPAAAASKLAFLRANPESDAASLIRSERLKAKAAGRVLVVYAGAGWCEPCKKFHEAAQSGAFDDKLGKVTLLEFDADRDGDRLGAAGYKFNYIPFFALPAADGSPAQRYETKGNASQATMDNIVRTVSGWL